MNDDRQPSGLTQLKIDRSAKASVKKKSWVMPLTLATSMARSAGLWGKALIDAVDNYRFMAGVGINAECLPAERNRLELSHELDAFGMPKAIVSFSAGANEKAIDRHATQLMRQIVEAAGATETMVLPRTPTQAAPAAWAPTGKPPWSTPMAGVSTSTIYGSVITRCSPAHSSRTRL